MNDKNEGRKYMLKNLLCHVVFEAAKVVLSPQKIVFLNFQYNSISILLLPLLVLRALSTFTLFLNSCAQLLKHQTFLKSSNLA
jgi:hypothetical protein